MNSFSEDILRRQLQGRVDADFTVQTIHRMSDGLDRSGQSVPRRDILREIYLGRLAHTRSLSPARPELVELCQSVLAAIETVTAQDVLYSWHIVSRSTHLTGISTPTRIVFSFPPYDASNPTVA